MAGIGDIFVNSIKTTTDMPSAQISGEGYSQLASMKNGDTFTAKVVKTDGADVTLRLSDGKLVGARLSSDMNISEGQNVTFQVKSNASSISIAPLLTNTATDISVLKALGQASIPVTDTSSQMVSEMMKAGMSIDRASILDMYSSVMSNPSSSVADIVDLTRLGLPVNQENLDNIENYKNLSYQIDQGMQEIAEKTDQALMDLVRGGDTGNAARLMNSVIETVLSHISETSDPLSLEKADPGYLNGNGIPPAEDNGTQVSSQASDEAVLKEQALPNTAGNDAGDVLSVIKDETGKTISGEKTADTGNLSDGAFNNTSAVNEKPVNAHVLNDPAARALELLKAMQNADTSSKGEQAVNASPGQEQSVITENGKAGADSAAYIRENDMSFADAFDKTVSVMRELTGNKDYSPSGTAELLKDINIFQSKALENGDTAGIRKLLSSDAFRKLTFDTLKNEWRISPSEVADKDKVESLYKRLSGQLSMLRDGLASVQAQNTPAFNAMNNMSSNIDFLQQINQMYAYIQLPLKLSGGDSAHGDLYVFSNRKNMTSDDSVVTAFLHLDMDNLGPVDVYVSMDVRSGGKVSTNFTVADDETLDLLNEHMDLLTERLRGRGYDLTCSMKIKGTDEPEEDALKAGGVNLLLLHAGSMGGSYSPGMKSFDVRA